METSSKLEKARKEGNTSLIRKDYIQAILCFTEGIKLCGTDYKMYSNRAVAFMKLEQYWLALQDTEKAIAIKPDWPKGYYRKGQVYTLAENYECACDALEEGLKKCPDSKELQDAYERAEKDRFNAVKKEVRLNNMGMVLGALFGILVVLLDAFISSKPILQGIIFQLVVVSVCTVSGLGITEIYRKYLRLVQSTYLSPPANTGEQLPSFVNPADTFSTGRSVKRNHGTKKE